jgi:hypothetical protein
MIEGDTTLVLPTLAKSDGAGVFMPRSGIERFVVTLIPCYGF